MSVERKTPIVSRSPEAAGRSQTPSPEGLRHRLPLRAATFNIRENDRLRRRSSFFSETFSETHKSFRTSTDDLLLPRIKTTSAHDDQIETSHWHSVPLGLALLPAVGGLFFKDGSAVVTDITLLGLAAVFLNWALRLPWEWYKAAQSTVTVEYQPVSSTSPIDEEDDETLGDGDEDAGKPADLPQARATANVENSQDEDILAAQQELRLHEFLALLACFIFPVLGAWLLHAIRSQLSRPSESLISNYNLTIFLLVAEIRPLSHMIKLVQKRTLFLQRKINSRVLQEQRIEERQDLTDMSRRLEELESHVANTAAASPPENTVPSDSLVSKVSTQATADVRKSFQPELDALNRAMRRYEKRMTITAIQVESRLQELETRLQDVVALAAAAQRSADKYPRNYTSILMNWASAFVVVPTQYAYRVISLPGKLAQSLINSLGSLIGLKRRPETRDTKATQRPIVARNRGVQRKGKTAA